MREYLIKSTELIKWLDKEINGLELPTDTRTRLVAGCFDIVLEHQKAIILLALNNIYGSAYSLLRPLFETYIRGLWLFRCATKNEISQFQKGKINKQFWELIVDIEKIEGYHEGVLSKSKNSSWSAMNDFTHGGINQVSRRNKENTIEPNYDNKEVLEIINFTNSIAILAALEISFMTNEKQFSTELAGKMKDLGRWGIKP